MFGWLKRRKFSGKGPDYRHVDSTAKAEALFRRGELQKLLLLPLEFGGEDSPLNVVFVPPYAAALKSRLDQNTIVPLVRKGLVSKYTATPQYEGKSVVPSQIHVAAADPGSFGGTIAIWGESVHTRSEPAMQAPDPLPDLTEPWASTAAVDALAPEDLVRAFIAEYASWNQYAHLMSARDDGAGMAAAQSAYKTLLQKFCPPGLAHQPIAFGSDSMHDPLRETIVATNTGADTSVVSTRKTNVVGTMTMTYDHEYHLKRTDGRWHVTSVLYVDKDGKYEGL